MPGYYHHRSARSTAKHDLSSVPKVCPKYVRNIKTYLKISKLIEILEPLKMSVFLGNVIVFFRLAFSTASFTR